MAVQYKICIANLVEKRDLVARLTGDIALKLSVSKQMSTEKNTNDKE